MTTPDRGFAFDLADLLAEEGLSALRAGAAVFWSRLSGREAASLRYQRDAHAEEAGRERQRRRDAEQALAAVLHAIDTAMTGTYSETVVAASVAQRALRGPIRIGAICEQLCRLRESEARAKRLLREMVNGCDEHVLAEAAEWVRGGLPWMPGEAKETECSSG